MDYVRRARARGDCGYATMRAREAIDMLTAAHGAGSMADASPLQKLWRDVSTGCRHAVSNTIFNEEIYGRALLGVPYEENVSPLI
jgi:alkylation response protein AidB-like acyl-CoA dehydrogenase